MLLSIWAVCKVSLILFKSTEAVLPTHEAVLSILSAPMLCFALFRWIAFCRLSPFSLFLTHFFRVSLLTAFKTQPGAAKETFAGKLSRGVFGSATCAEFDKLRCQFQSTFGFSIASSSPSEALTAVPDYWSPQGRYSSTTGCPCCPTLYSCRTSRNAFFQR